MHVPSAPSAVSLSLLHGSKVVPRARVNTERTALAVESIGYLVPRSDFAGRVHSIFAQACNIASADGLLTLSAFGGWNAPTTLRLSRGAVRGLRRMFDIGEPVHGREGRMLSRRVEIQLDRASVWRPVPLSPLLPRSRIETHLRTSDHRLAQWRGSHRSVIDGPGAPVAHALRDACRALDCDQAVRHADRLVGWGEGLTPAGDDFLIGLIAGLGALARDQSQRRELRRAVAAALRRATPRTTPIAAHYLQLAADGHYTEPLLRLREALLCQDDDQRVDSALHTALAVGGTSGADTVSGLLAALQAWLPTIDEPA
jgi:hypothetical protein